MLLKNDQTIAQRKADNLRRLSDAYTDALKKNTVRKVVTLGKHKTTPQT